MRISVVIPTFKRSKLLIRCLDSIYKQSLAADLFEVIVVSDGPDHATEYLVTLWKTEKGINLKFIQSPVKAGPAAARNLGWLAAKAPLIAFIDDDCMADKYWLRALNNAYKDEELIAFSGCTKVPIPLQPTDFAHNLAQLETAEFITANCACTKSALLAIGGFDQRFKMAWREDSDLHFKLLSHNIPIKKIADALVIHPVTNRPWGNSLKEQCKAQYEALLYKKFPNIYRQKIDKKQVYQFYVINLCLLGAAVAYFSKKEAWMWLCLFSSIALITSFAIKRIKPTSKAYPHVVEMLITSLLIPSISCYWRLRGALKFRTFFI